MWKSFTVNGNYEWLTLLPKIVKSYNNTIHSTIGMKPKDVRQKHVKAILNKINKTKTPVSSKQKFSVGDKVRISKAKMVFKKGYLPSWTTEVFNIYAIKPTKPPTYILKDHNGEILKGGFYEQGLSKSKTGDVYLVERVLQRKGDKLLIKWLGFDKSHNTWVDKSNLVS